MAKKAAFEGLEHLVEKFQANEDEYLSPSFNEAQLRLSFLNPLFRALGWDTENVHEVRVEDASDTAGRPDYVFRLEGATKFYVEAKKPSANLDDPEIIFQAKRYAWNSQTPNLVVVLTNFRVWRVYDGSPKPDAMKPHVGLLLDLALEDYTARIKELEKFSREEVAEGSLEALVKASIRKHKDFRKSVDRDFLDQIQAWRKELAKSIYKRNPDLDERTLNETVGRLLDRLVFLRIAEDKRILPPYRMREKADLWKARPKTELQEYLNDLFHDVNENLNGEVFKPGHACERYFAESKVLERIIEALYPPKCIYRFEVIPVEVLGQMYEQYLGYVLRTTPKQVRLEEKPEVRKAGGVYYTPRYIVDYIVKKTVGEKLKGMTPQQAMRLKILDPACGSGSFLLGAFDYLLRWYEGKRMKGRPLTLTDKGKILTSNLHGVDIDPQAVEITMMSLYLKMLEDEHMPLFSRHVLPLLGDNVKCGNSLIGPDYWEGRLVVDDEERLKINAFDWEAEFPKVFKGKNKGFDCAIGNPPYIRIQTLRETQSDAVDYLSRAYESAKAGNYDIYVVFVEQGASLLAKDGRLGYICPNKFFTAKYGEGLRRLLTKEKLLDRIVDFSDQQVFEGATTYTCLLFLEKDGKLGVNVLGVPDLKKFPQGKTFTVKELSEEPWNLRDPGVAFLVERLEKAHGAFGEFTTKIFQGIRTSANEIYVLRIVREKGNAVRVHSKALEKEITLERALLKQFLSGANVKPFSLEFGDQVVLVPYEVRDGKASLVPQNTLKRDYPLTWKYLMENKKQLEERERGRFKGKSWYGYSRVQNIEAMLGIKLITPDIANRASFAWDENGEYFFTSGYGISLKEDVCMSPLYFLGLLNSRLLDRCFKHKSTMLRGGYYRYFTQYIKQLPIRTINFSDPKEKKQHDEMVVLVERMLALHKKLHAAPEGTSRRAQLERDIRYTDAAIDKLVYKLYGLTEEEIKVVENV